LSLHDKVRANACSFYFLRHRRIGGKHVGQCFSVLGGFEILAGYCATNVISDILVYEECVIDHKRSVGFRFTGDFVFGKDPGEFY